MRDEDVMESCRNRQLNDYLDGCRSGEENWEACEEFIAEELSGMESMFYDIMTVARGRYNLDNSDVKDMIIEALKDML